MKSAVKLAAETAKMKSSLCGPRRNARNSLIHFMANFVAMAFDASVSLRERGISRGPLSTLEPSLILFDAICDAVSRV